MRLKIRPRTALLIDSELGGGEPLTLELGTGGPTIRYEFRFPYPLRTNFSVSLGSLADRICDDQYAGKSNIRAYAERDRLVLWSVDETERVVVNVSSTILRFTVVEDRVEETSG